MRELKEKPFKEGRNPASKPSHLRTLMTLRDFKALVRDFFTPHAIIKHGYFVVPHWNLARFPRWRVQVMQGHISSTPFYVWPNKKEKGIGDAWAIYVVEPYPDLYLSYAKTLQLKPEILFAKDCPVFP